MSLVKVSVENLDTNDKMLHEIDMSKSLEENINNVCEIFQKPYSSAVFGLKILSTNDGKTLHTYISSDNFNEIKDGYFLKLVYSLGHYVKRIFDHIGDQYKERSFQDLYELSVDPEFIKEMVKNEKHLTVMNTFTYSELTETEATACLIAIVHLLQRLHITEIDEPFMSKIISLLKNAKNDELIKYVLSVVHKILVHRDQKFGPWKEEAIKRITIPNLIDFIKKREDVGVQYGALLVINSMIKCCKGEKRQQLIKEINQKSCREAIYQHIISRGNVDRDMGRELYTYQTYLLSVYAEALNSVISNNPDIFSPDEFELEDREIKKLTILMDFDETATKNKTISLDNLLDHDDVRISLASMSSRFSDDSRYSHRMQSTATNESIEYENLKPSLLTIEALRHYRHFHYKNYYQSQVEERIYEPGIVASSERVIKMLAKILQIGMEPDRSSTCYQPTIFTCSSKTPFFFELFSRTMWLLSKTRREMRATTLLDYDKVINVLTKQIRLVLDDKPMDFKKLIEKMIEINHDAVVEIWQKEKQEELRFLLDHNPSVKILKNNFSKVNEKIIFDQRINYIKKGTLFPKFIDKKINGNFQAKLSNNSRHLIINDYNVATKTVGEVRTCPLDQVTHVVEGKACPHVKNNSVKEPYLAFSIILNNDDWINFKAADKKTANYWLDALNLLLGKDNRSTYYTDELKELNEMDIVLHLMELQNVPIPKRAPPVPRTPFEIKPIVPPKPTVNSSHLTKL